MSSKQDNQRAQKKMCFLKFILYLTFVGFVSTRNRILLNLQSESEVCEIGVKDGVCCVFIKKNVFSSIMTYIKKAKLVCCHILCFLQYKNTVSKFLSFMKEVDRIMFEMITLNL